MFATFEALHEAHHLDIRPREDMLYSEEKAFVEDCFETYEHIGFAKTFKTPYTEEKHLDGQPFTVIGRVKEADDDPENGADLECLPMWHIRFEDGTEKMAFPEEICVAERMSDALSEMMLDRLIAEISTTHKTKCEKSGLSSELYLTAAVVSYLTDKHTIYDLLRLTDPTEISCYFA